MLSSEYLFHAFSITGENVIVFVLARYHRSSSSAYSTLVLNVGCVITFEPSVMHIATFSCSFIIPFRDVTSLHNFIFLRRFKYSSSKSLTILFLFYHHDSHCAIINDVNKIISYTLSRKIYLLFIKLVFINVNYARYLIAYPCNQANTAQRRIAISILLVLF